MSVATIGARMINAIAIITMIGLLLSLFLLLPADTEKDARKKKSAASVTMPTSTTATVETTMSRLPTCESSCAMTPSQLALVHHRESPLVTATAAWSLRPVAKALGAGSLMM